MAAEFEPGDRVKLNPTGLENYRIMRNRNPNRQGTIKGRPKFWDRQPWKDGLTFVHWDGTKRAEHVQEEYLEKVEDNA